MNDDRCGMADFNVQVKKRARRYVHQGTNWKPLFRSKGKVGVLLVQVDIDLEQHCFSTSETLQYGKYTLYNRKYTSSIDTLRLVVWSQIFDSELAL